MGYERARPELRKTMEFWSIPAKVEFRAAAGDKTMSSVAIPNITGYTIERAYAFISIDSLFEMAGNRVSLDVDQYVQVDKSAAGWLSAIKFEDNSFDTHSDFGYPMGGKIVGDVDILTRVAFNTSTDFRWLQAKSNADALDMYIRSGVILWVVEE